MEANEVLEKIDVVGRDTDEIKVGLEILEEEKTLNLDGGWYDLVEDLFGIGDALLCEVKQIIEGKVLVDTIHFGSSGYSNYATFPNDFNFVGGEVILIQTDGYSHYSDEEEKIEKIWIVNKDIVDEKLLKSFLKKLVGFGKLSLNDIKKKRFLNKSNIQNAIRKRVERISKERGEEEKEEEEIKRKRKEEEKKKNVDFKKKDVCVIGDINIDGKEVIINNIKFILKKKVNKIFDYSFFTNYNYVGSIEDNLIRNEKNFIREEKNEETDEWEKKYEITFERDKKKEIIAELENKKFNTLNKINGIKVNRAKINFVLARIGKDTTKEKIKLLNKLTRMKCDISELKNIACANHRININISLVDENNFEVEFINQIKKVDWDFIKDWFFSGRSIYGNFDKRKSLLLIKELGIPKEKFYTYLKNVVLIKELEEDKK